MIDVTYTQFVLFDTPLPELAFLSVWTPFAQRYLDQGLQQITLYKREGKSLLGDAPDFISHNRWPKQAFESVLSKGEIGEGSGWPIEATQGGTFADAKGVSATHDVADLVIALIKLRPGSIDPVAYLGAERPDLFAHPVARAPRRFDAVLIAPIDRSDARHAVEELTRRQSDRLDPQSSKIAAYSYAKTSPERT